MDKTVESPRPRFYTQYDTDLPSWAQENNEPSCTIPDQTMTIQEIIAKYTRTGLVPASRVRGWDQGGNDTDEYAEDPLDEYSEVLEAARQEGSRSKGPAASPAPAGEGESSPDPNSPAAPSAPAE